MSDMNLLQNCRFIKTILMLLVIFGHSIAFWSGAWFTENPAIPSDGLNYLYGWVNSFHIFDFTLVSGYIYTYKRIGGGYNKWLSFINHKAKRLLVPYVFAMIIWVAPISAYFFNWDKSYLMEKYVLCINPSQLWFFWMLFGVFMISWPLWKVFYENKLLGAVIALVFYCLGIIGDMVLPNIFCIWTACQYVCFFYIGIRIRCEQKEKHLLFKEVPPWWCWIIIDIILYVIYVEVLDVNGNLAGILGMGVEFLLHIVGAIMAFMVLQKIAERVCWEQSVGFRVLSSYSMPMYLFHQQLIYFSIVWLNGRVNPWINAAVNFTFALTVGLLISWILMKFKFTRFLVGEK